jgi:hypothetical protein
MLKKESPKEFFAWSRGKSDEPCLLTSWWLPLPTARICEEPGVTLTLPSDRSKLRAFGWGVLGRGQVGQVDVTRVRSSKVAQLQVPEYYLS